MHVRARTHVLRVPGGITLRLLIVFVLSLISCDLALAGGPPTYYSYYPGSVMSLGRGFDPQRLDAAKMQCLSFIVDEIDSGVALSTQSRLFMARTKEELRFQLGLDSQADARYLIFKASASYNIDFNRAITSDSATFVFYYSTEFGRQAIKDWKLTDYAQGLLTDRRFEQFRQDCGSQIVAMTRRASTVAAVVTVHNIDTSTKAQLSGQIGGGVDLEEIGFNVKGKLSTALDIASREGNIDIQVVSTGGAGFGSLSDSVKAISNQETGDALTAISNALNSYIKTFSVSNAAPIGYHVRPFPNFSEVYGDLWSEEKVSKLLQIVDEYRQAKSDRDAVKNVISGIDPRADFLTTGQIESLKAILPQLDSYVSTVAATHGKCLAATAAQVRLCSIPPNTVTLPEYMYPVDRMPSTFAVIVDGEPWLRARAAEVLQDPGSGGLLDKVRIRKPTAQSAYTAIGFNTPYLSDITIIIRVDGREYPQKVFYPGQSVGDKVAPNRASWSFVVYRSDTKLPYYDWTPHFAVAQWLKDNKCRDGSLVLPYDKGRHLKGDIIARARNRYGLKRDFQIATLTMYREVPWLGCILGLCNPSKFYILFTSGEQSGEWRVTNSVCEGNYVGRITRNPNVLPNDFHMLMDELGEGFEGSIAPISDGIHYYDKPTVCINDLRVYPEGAVIKRGLQSEKCSSGKWQVLK